MYIINNINATKFEIDGIPYLKNYISEVAGSQITIFNAYDKKDVRLDWVNFGEINLNGTVYGNVADLQSALLPVIYTRASLGGGSGIQSVVAGTNVTVDDSDPLNPIVNASSGAVTSVNGQTGVVVIPTTPLVQEANGYIHRADLFSGIGGDNSVNLTVNSGVTMGIRSYADSDSVASGNSSHADSGGSTLGNFSHADSGGSTLGNFSHADSGGFASGNNSHANGRGVIANSYSETAVGVHNEDVTPQSAIVHNPIDLAFSVGIGTSFANRLTSFSVFKNGGFKFVARALTNITNAVKGFFAFDEQGRPNAHDGTSWKPLAYLSDITGGATNLSYTPSPTSGTVVSDTGTDATIPLTDGTNAGLLSPSEKTEIGTIANKENTSNKATNLTAPDNIKYPTTLAVQNALNVVNFDIDNVLENEILENGLVWQVPNVDGSYGSGTGSQYMRLSSVPVVQNNATDQFFGISCGVFQTTAVAGTIASIRRNDNLNINSFNTAILTRDFQVDSNISNDCRYFVGLSKNFGFAVPTNNDITTHTECIYVAKLSTSNNLHLVHNDNAGLATTIDLGVNFPANSNLYKYRFYLIKRSASNYDVKIFRRTFTTGVILESANYNLTTNLPTAGGILHQILAITNNATATNMRLGDYGLTLKKIPL